jgi:hypothetical protein
MYVFIYAFIYGLFTVAARSKAYVCGRALAGIVGSNPPRGMDFFSCIVFVL